MMRGQIATLIMATGIAVAAPASGQDRVLASHAALMDGRPGVAERMLEAERRVASDRPEVLLNLAAVYATTGRAGDARALYASVLSQDDVAMDQTRGRVTSAHAIARAGLARVTPLVTAAR